MQIKNQFYDLKDTFGVLKISGFDAKKLLQGQVTRDVEKIMASPNAMTALCNPQGRIISLFYLAQLNDSYYLIMPRTMVAITHAALKKFAVFYKVELVDSSSEWSVLGYQGEVHAIPTLLKIRLPDSRYLVASEPSLLAEIKQPAFETLSLQTWQLVNIQHKIPAIYSATSGKILPHEINLPNLNAIDFDKGCYTGQEIIARMHYKGKLKNHMHIAEINTATAVQPGMTINKKIATEILNCGIVIDVCYNNDNSLALIVIDDSSITQPLFLEQDTQALITLES